MRDPDDVKKFMLWYHRAIPEHRTCAATYSATETVWIMEFGKRFYKNYESFRAAKSYYMKHNRRC